LLGQLIDFCRETDDFLSLRKVERKRKSVIPYVFAAIEILGIALVMCTREQSDTELCFPVALGLGLYRTCLLLSFSSVRVIAMKTNRQNNAPLTVKAPFCKMNLLLVVVEAFSK
jgi:hypothetical protein